MFLMAGGLGGLLQPMTGLFHESWAALLLALMIAHPPARARLAGDDRGRRGADGSGTGACR